MLTLSRPLSSGKVAEYFRQPDPILKACGTWQGKGAERLDLIGEVREPQLKAVLEGVNPQTGEQLRERAKTGHDRAAVDLILSAPKSLSIGAISDQSLISAHQQAVTATIDQIESYAQTRQQIDGVRSTVVTSNLIIAQFDHFLSRSLDPQLHSHLIVMNLTQLNEEQWRALDNKPLYQYQLALGQFYRSELGQQLREMGLQLTTTDSERNFFELKGIPDELISLFSSRREELCSPALLENLRENYPHASEARLHELATYITRQDKETEIAKNDLIRVWRETAQEKGHDLDRLPLTKNPDKAIGVEHDQTPAGHPQQEISIPERSIEHHAPSESILADFLSRQESSANEKEQETHSQEYTR